MRAHYNNHNKNGTYRHNIIYIYYIIYFIQDLYTIPHEYLTHNTLRIMITQQLENNGVSSFLNRINFKQIKV